MQVSDIDDEMLATYKKSFLNAKRRLLHVCSLDFEATEDQDQLLDRLTSCMFVFDTMLHDYKLIKKAHVTRLAQLLPE